MKAPTADYSPLSQALSAKNSAIQSGYAAKDAANWKSRYEIQQQSLDLQRQSVDNSDKWNGINLGLNLAKAGLDFAGEVMEYKERKDNNTVLQTSNAYEAEAKKFIAQHSNELTVGDDGGYQFTTPETQQAWDDLKSKWQTKADSLKIGKEHREILNSTINNLGISTETAFTIQGRENFDKNADTALRSEAGAMMDSVLSEGGYDMVVDEATGLELPSQVLALADVYYPSHLSAYKGARTKFLFDASEDWKMKSAEKDLYDTALSLEGDLDSTLQGMLDSGKYTPEQSTKLSSYRQQLDAVVPFRSDKAQYNSVRNYTLSEDWGGDYASLFSKAVEVTGGNDMAAAERYADTAWKAIKTSETADYNSALDKVSDAISGGMSTEDAIREFGGSLAGYQKVQLRQDAESISSFLESTGDKATLDKALKMAREGDADGALKLIESQVSESSQTSAIQAVVARVDVNDRKSYDDALDKITDALFDDGLSVDDAINKYGVDIKGADREKLLQDAESIQAFIDGRGDKKVLNEALKLARDGKLDEAKKLVEDSMSEANQTSGLQAILSRSNIKTARTESEQQAYAANYTKKFTGYSERFTSMLSDPNKDIGVLVSEIESDDSLDEADREKLVASFKEKWRTERPYALAQAQYKKDGIALARNPIRNDGTLTPTEKDSLVARLNASYEEWLKEETDSASAQATKTTDAIISGEAGYESIGLDYENFMATSGQYPPEVWRVKKAAYEQAVSQAVDTMFQNEVSSVLAGISSGSKTGYDDLEAMYYSYSTGEKSGLFKDTKGDQIEFLSKDKASIMTTLDGNLTDLREKYGSVNTQKRINEVNNLITMYTVGDENGKRLSGKEFVTRLQGVMRDAWKEVDYEAGGLDMSKLQKVYEEAIGKVIPKELKNDKNVTAALSKMYQSMFNSKKETSLDPEDKLLWAQAESDFMAEVMDYVRDTPEGYLDKDGFSEWLDHRTNQYDADWYSIKKSDTSLQTTWGAIVEKPVTAVSNIQKMLSGKVTSVTVGDTTYGSWTNVPAGTAVGRSNIQLSGGLADVFVEADEAVASYITNDANGYTVEVNASEVIKGEDGEDKLRYLLKRNPGEPVRYAEYNLKTGELSVTGSSNETEENNASVPLINESGTGSRVNWSQIKQSDYSGSGTLPYATYRQLKNLVDNASTEKELKELANEFVDNMPKGADLNNLSEAIKARKKELR